MGEGKSDDRDRVRAEVTLAREQAELLEEMYPSAASLPEAIRSAIRELICRRDGELTQEEIAEAITQALEESVACSDD